MLTPRVDRMLTAFPAALQVGRTAPMGALARDGGVNFAVFSQHATSIQPCIFGTASSLQSASGIVYTEASPFKIPARAVQVLRGITMNHLPKT